MLVVSNTSPLLNLALVGRLSLIREQFGNVVVPSVVREELQLESDLPGAYELRQAFSEGTIVTDEHSGGSGVQRSLSLTLDLGEASAIALALDRHAEWILLDDLDARHTAAALGLRVTGVVGIVLRAKRDGSIDCVEAELHRLRDKAGFRLGSRLIAEALRAAGEGGA